MTAGHCFPKGFFDRAHVYSTYPTTLGERAANFGGKTSIGSNMMSIQVNGDYHGDVALMNVEELGRAAYAQFWTGGRYGTANSAVLARSAPAIGNYICGGGVVSGALGCVGNLQIKGVNEDFVSNGTVFLRNGDRARGDTHSECSDSGDSGGSIYVGNTAIGVISGHTNHADGSCQQRFTGAEEAIQAWGGVVLGE